MSDQKFSLHLKPYPLAHRFVFAAGVAVVVFLLISAVLIFVPAAESAILRVVFPIVMFLLGALWSFVQLPWYLGFLTPCALFVLLAFLRLNGVYALQLLIGYVPLAFAGALAMFVIVQYMKRNGMLSFEGK